MQLALELPHPVYDCLYLALARRLGTSCITADRKLLSVAPAGLAVALADWPP
jgi:predicted nucleic acid-binding protein